MACEGLEKKATPAADLKNVPVPAYVRRILNATLYSGHRHLLSIFFKDGHLLK